MMFEEALIKAVNDRKILAYVDGEELEPEVHEFVLKGESKKFKATDITYGHPKWLN